MTKESLFDLDVLLRKPRQEARTNPWMRTIRANKKTKTGINQIPVFLIMVGAWGFEPQTH